MPFSVVSARLGGRTIWVAEDVEVARELYGDGVRDPIFFGFEIDILEAGAPCDQALQLITAAKDVWPGCQIKSHGAPGLAPSTTVAKYDPSRQRSKKFAMGNRTGDNRRHD